MARRRLSDLLRDEVNKPSDDATAAAGAEQTADEPDAEALDAAGQTATIASAGHTKASTAAKHHSTKQDETTAIQTTPEQKQDEALGQQIADLTSALDAQKVTIEQLQVDLEYMNALKTELEQTRKDVRQLANSNAKLTEELKTLQTQKTAAETSTLATKAPAHSYQELRLSSPPIAPTSNPPNSFNKDVGWFD